MGIHFNKREEKAKRRKLRQQQTYCEKIVWLHLRNRKLLGVKFRRQYSVDQYVIDFYSPELKLALEIDGSVHDVRKQREYDKRRQKHIEQFGIKFLRIRNEELLTNSNKTFKRIEEKIREIKQNPSPKQKRGPDN